MNTFDAKNGDISDYLTADSRLYSTIAPCQYNKYNLNEYYI